MATTRAALTESDIRMLVKGATPDERALAAHKLCRNIDRAVLTDEERQVAHDILRVMAADAAELVRRALSHFRLPYITITPTFSICPVHGYLSGEHEFCPRCDEEALARRQRAEPSPDRCCAH